MLLYKGNQYNNCHGQRNIQQKKKSLFAIFIYSWQLWSNNPLNFNYAGLEWSKQFFLLPIFLYIVERILLEDFSSGMQKLDAFVSSARCEYWNDINSCIHQASMTPIDQSIISQSRYARHDKSTLPYYRPRPAAKWQPLY